MAMLALICVMYDLSLWHTDSVVEAHVPVVPALRLSCPVACGILVP